MEKRHNILIIGGGFGGLHVALSSRPTLANITLVDRRNFHLFQPLLYQVATGGLSPAEIATPLRLILSRHRNVRIIMSELVGIDAKRRIVTLRDNYARYTEHPFDTLVVASGSHHHYFGNDQWKSWAPGLKTIEDATAIRSKLLSAFEYAEGETDPDRVRDYLTFVIVGAGPTGVELAGTLAEIARDTLKHDFRNINPADARIVIIERADRLLNSYPESLSVKAQKSLEALGVEVKTNSSVEELGDGHVVVRGARGVERVAAETIVWAAGVKASPLGALLAQSTGADLDRSGRVVVQADLSLKDHPDIFVIGDLACCADKNGLPLPGIAPVAMQQGKYVALVIKNRLRHKGSPAFRYRNFGNMATIGRHSAVADLGWLRLSGYFAWLLWLFVHLMYLVGFENRLLVLVHWAWSYITRNRSARLITEYAKTAHSETDRIEPQ